MAGRGRGVVEFPFPKDEEERAFTVELIRRNDGTLGRVLRRRLQREAVMAERHWRHALQAVDLGSNAESGQW